MSRSLVLAGLLVDSWRDQSPQMESSEMSLLGDAIPISRLRGTSEDAPSTPRLMSMIALGTIKWESR
jgi:hypothetical protein